MDPNNKASKYMKHKLIQLKGEIDTLIYIIGDFNTPLPIIDKIDDRIVI